MNRNDKAPEEQRQEAEFRKAQERKDLEFVLSDPRGRRVLWRYIAAGRPFAVDMPGDLAVINYRNGERAAATRIMLDVMEFSPDAFFEMSKEGAQK